MELWIRSQDKTTLIRSYEIYITEYGKDSYVIKAKRTSHILGAYKTMERALEVLDEIQNIFDCCLKANGNNQICGTSTYVYEMPED